MNYVSELSSVARVWLATAQEQIRFGQKIEPRLAMVTEEGALACIDIYPALPPDQEGRTTVLKLLAEKVNGVALLYMTDAYLRDPDTNVRTGEVIHALVQARDGVAVTLSVRYSRAPLTFEPVSEDVVAPPYPVWEPGAARTRTQTAVTEVATKIKPREDRITWSVPEPGDGKKPTIH